MNPFENAWRILKEQPISPDNRYTGTMAEWERNNPDAGPDDRPYKTQKCPVCRMDMPYDGHSGTNICSPECEQIMQESQRSYQINQQQKNDKNTFLQTQLDRMREINPKANYPNSR